MSELSDFTHKADALAAFERLPDNALMRPDEASLYSKLKWGRGSRKTLAKLRCWGGGPAFQKIGPAVVYTKKSIDDWNRAKISAPMASTSSRAA